MKKKLSEFDSLVRDVSLAINSALIKNGCYEHEEEIFKWAVLICKPFKDE